MTDMIIYNPQAAIEQAKSARMIVVGMRQEVLRKDVDFGKIPGTNDKDVLLKPGAEKLCTAFGLRPEFDAVSIREDFDTGLFFYRYRCTLYHIATNLAIATGIGSCSSYESKYLWRNLKPACPACGKELFKSKDKPEYFCWKKKDGCGATFGDKDQRILSQPLGRIKNPDIIDTANTIDKMAQKRSLVAAVLIGTGASEFFTQDLEDFPRYNPDSEDVIEAEYVEPGSNGSTKPDPKPAAAEKPAQPKGQTTTEPTTNGNGNHKHSTFAALITYLHGLEATLPKGTVQGTISEGQQKNLAIAMQDVMDNDTRKFLIQEAFGVDSSKQLNERRFFALKEWLANDPQQVEADVKLVIAARKAQLEGAAATPAGGS